LPIECWHEQVTQDHIVAVLTEEGKGGLTIGGGLDGVSIALE
jgi:hypothetical protein